MQEYSYDNLLAKAKADGMVTEMKMWQSAYQAAKYMEMAQRGELSKEAYWAFMREQHELFYGPHYNEDFAKYDVSNIRYTGKSNDRRSGEYWSKAQIEDATKGMSFPAGTTVWDKYVAFNSFHADLCQVMEDEMILKAAHKYFFQDEDSPDGKIWKYMQAMKKI